MNQNICAFYNLEGIEIEDVLVEEEKIEISGYLQNERQACTKTSVSRMNRFSSQFSNVLKIF